MYLPPPKEGSNIAFSPKRDQAIYMRLYCYYTNHERAPRCRPGTPGAGLDPNCFEQDLSRFFDPEI